MITVKVDRSSLKTLRAIVAKPLSLRVGSSTPKK